MKTGERPERSPWQSAVDAERESLTAALYGIIVPLGASELSMTAGIEALADVAVQMLNGLHPGRRADFVLLFMDRLMYSLRATETWPAA